MRGYVVLSIKTNSDDKADGHSGLGYRKKRCSDPSVEILKISAKRRLQWKGCETRNLESTLHYRITLPRVGSCGLVTWFLPEYLIYHRGRLKMNDGYCRNAVMRALIRR